MSLAVPRTKTRIGFPAVSLRTLHARAKPRKIFRPEPTIGPLPDCRRRARRYEIDANVQLQLSRSLAIFARAVEVSRTGIRIQVHGSATPGQRFLVVFRPGARTWDGATAEVRWVGRSNLEGVRAVGMQWVENEAGSRSRPRIESLLERARATR